METIKKYLYNAWELVSKVLADLTAQGNTGGRLVVFTAVYFVFSLVGAYNFAHFAAFVYIIWLLEK
jgi:hypothetical protein